MIKKVKELTGEYELFSVSSPGMLTVNDITFKLENTNLLNKAVFDISSGEIKVNSVTIDGSEISGKKLSECVIKSSGGTITLSGVVLKSLPMNNVAAVDVREFNTLKMD